MIMVLHDPSDIILEVTKMLNYAEQELPSTIMFVVFMLSWLLTRLIYFPFWIVLSTRSASCPASKVSKEQVNRTGQKEKKSPCPWASSRDLLYLEAAQVVTD